MITGFVVKTVFGIALLAAVLFEAAGPLVVRGQLDDQAHDAADQAAFLLREGKSRERAEEEIRAIGGDHLDSFSIEEGVVRVVLVQDADSLVVKRYVEPLRSWYRVRVEATATVD